jgi:hypothetical protein
VKTALRDSIAKVIDASGDNFEPNAASAFGYLKRSVQQVGALTQGGTEAVLSEIDDATRTSVIVFLCSLIKKKRMYSKQVRVTLDVLLMSPEWQATWQNSGDLVASLPENWGESQNPRGTRPEPIAKKENEAAEVPYMVLIAPVLDATAPAVEEPSDLRARIGKALGEALATGELQKAVEASAISAGRYSDTRESHDSIRDRIAASLNSALAAGVLAKAIEDTSVSEVDECKFDNDVAPAEEKHQSAPAGGHSLEDCRGLRKPAEEKHESASARGPSLTPSRPSFRRRRKRDMIRAFFGRALICLQ